MILDPVFDILRFFGNLIRFVVQLEWLPILVEYPLMSVLLLLGSGLIIYPAYHKRRKEKHRPWSDYTITELEGKWIDGKEVIVSLFGVMIILISVVYVGGSGTEPERVDVEPVTAEENSITSTPIPESSFAFDIEIKSNRVYLCFPNICVNATAKIRNTGKILSESISVELIVYLAGQDSNQTIWKGIERVGTLAPGDSHSTIRTIKIGPTKANQVKENGCAFSSKFIVNYRRGQKIYTTYTDLPDSKCEII